MEFLFSLIDPSSKEQDEILRKDLWRDNNQMHANYEYLTLMSRGNGNTPGRGQSHMNRKPGCLKEKRQRHGRERKEQARKSWGRLKVLVALQIIYSFIFTQG